MIRRAVAWLLRIYQMAISPMIPGCCRFSPTCSEYTRQAVLEHGIAGGAWLGLRRLARCHPFHPGGHDPVPSPRG